MASAMATRLACASALKDVASSGGDHIGEGRRRRTLLRERSGSLRVYAAAAAARVCENRDAGDSREVSETSSGGGVVVSRRQALTLTTLSASAAVLFSSSQAAQARDVPLFGFRKVQKQVVDELKELVKEGEAEAQAVSGAVSGLVKTTVADFSVPSSKASPSEGGPSPALQAGVVAGAELVAVLVASTVVNGLVSPSK